MPDLRSPANKFARCREASDEDVDDLSKGVRWRWSRPLVRAAVARSPRPRRGDTAAAQRRDSKATAR
jgi:hypothetical protein